MVTDKSSEIFTQKEKKLEATWDATLEDMIRCKYILKAYNELDILSNVQSRSAQLIKGIKNPRVKNLRCAGLLVGFDLGSSKERNEFQQSLCNRTKFIGKIFQIIDRGLTTNRSMKSCNNIH